MFAISEDFITISVITFR